MTDRTSTLTVSVDPDLTGPSVLKVSGELDQHTAPKLREALDELAIGAGVVLDLRDLVYCDSCGITVLISAQQRARTQDSSLPLAGLDPDLARHLRLLGLADVFAFHATVEQAVLSLRGKA